MKGKSRRTGGACRPVTGSLPAQAGGANVKGSGIPDCFKSSLTQASLQENFGTICIYTEAANDSSHNRNSLADSNRFTEYSWPLILFADGWDTREIYRHNSATSPARVTTVRRVDCHSLFQYPRDIARVPSICSPRIPRSHGRGPGC